MGPAEGPGEVDIGPLSGTVTAIESNGEVTPITESVPVLDGGTGDVAIPQPDRAPGAQVEPGDGLIAPGAATESAHRPQDVVVMDTAPSRKNPSSKTSAPMLLRCSTHGDRAVRPSNFDPMFAQRLAASPPLTHNILP